MSSWFSRAKNVLNYENETWLAYLYGQKFEHLKHLQESEPRFKGRYFRFAIWVYLLFKNARLRSSPNSGECDYLFFAGTINQKNSLATTVDALKVRKINVRIIVPKAIATRTEIEDRDYETMTINFLDAFKSLALSLMRAKSLSRQLQRKNSLLTIFKLDTFLDVYNSIVYFDTVLSKLKPRVVVVSNDHNAMNRCLIALARNAGVRTVYMQHASVSTLFPALNFNYSFLDGHSALEIYRQCDGNHPNASPFLGSRKVYLTGQKKKIQIENSLGIEDSKRVGVALNALDSIEAAEQLLRALVKNKFKVLLRWHPALSSKLIYELKTKLKSNQVDFSDPKFESLGGFFGKVYCMIAGNSSIHLEAALVYVVPIYYEINKQHSTDYYGYVKNGMSVNAENSTQLVDIINQIKYGKLTINRKAIQFYSSTFGTSWEGREGELVAESLIAIDKGNKPPILGISL